MRGYEPQLVATNPSLALLRDISISKIHLALASAIPSRLLDAPIDSYTVSSLRCIPRRKLVLGLTSPQSMRPIALSLFQQGDLQERLALAHQSHPHHSFALQDLSALAWVFPGEKKLNFDLLADRGLLSNVIKKHRTLTLQKVELMHFSPEYRYQARLTAERPDGSTAEEYLQVFHDLSGAHIASLIQQLNYQLHDTDLGIPATVSYLPDYRVLLQSSLQRDTSVRLSDRAAAKALAHLHCLSAVGLKENDRDYSSSLNSTEKLTCEAVPVQASLVSQIIPLIKAAIDDTYTGPQVLLHGDARYGSLIPLLHGRVGITDFDRMCWGAPEDDLANFYAFKIWREFRDNLSVDIALSVFPDFIDAYNRHANHPVDLDRAYAILAQKLVTDRIGLGIRNGEIASSNELFGLLYAAKCCLDQVWHCGGAHEFSHAALASRTSNIDRVALRIAPNPGRSNA